MTERGWSGVPEALTRHSDVRRLTMLQFGVNVFVVCHIHRHFGRGNEHIVVAVGLLRQYHLL